MNRAHIAGQPDRKLPTMKQITLTVIIVLLSVLPVHAAEPALSEKPSAAAVAWMRFTNGPETWDGVPYLWLNQTDLEIIIDVAPQAGDVLEILWGA